VALEGKSDPIYSNWARSDGRIKGPPLLSESGATVTSGRPGYLSSASASRCIYLAYHRLPSAPRLPHWSQLSLIATGICLHNVDSMGILSTVIDIKSNDISLKINSTVKTITFFFM